MGGTKSTVARYFHSITRVIHFDSHRISADSGNNARLTSYTRSEWTKFRYPERSCTYVLYTTVAGGCLYTFPKIEMSSSLSKNKDKNTIFREKRNFFRFRFENPTDYFLLRLLRTLNHVSFHEYVHFQPLGKKIGRSTARELRPGSYWFSAKMGTLMANVQNGVRAWKVKNIPVVRFIKVHVEPRRDNCYQ